MKTTGKYCYLCGRIISSRNGSRDHIPPKGLFPTPLNSAINYITLPAHKTCNNQLSDPDETFRNLLTSLRGNNVKAIKIWKEKTVSSFDKQGGKNKKKALSNWLSNYTISDNGTEITEPHLRIPANHDSLIPQFKRITKGIYYFKFKKYLDSNINIVFNDLEKFLKELNLNPNWKTIEKDIFQYFIYTSTENEKEGMIGMLFYNNLFVIAFFN